MARTLGSAFVQIRPDTSSFGPELKKGVNSADSAKVGEAAGTKMGAGVTSKLGHAAKVGGLLIGGAAVAGAYAFTKRAVGLEQDFGRTMNQLQAATDTPKRGMKSLSDLAIKMGADTVFSASDASQAMLELAKGGMNAAQIKSGALKSSLTLAAAGGIDMADAASTMGNAMHAFNIPAGQSATVAAALAGAANASSASVGSVALGLQQAGTVAADAGFTIQETTGAIAALSNAGIAGSDAGTSLKTMFSRLQPTTKSARDAFEAFGLSSYQSSGSMKELATKGIKPASTSIDDVSNAIRKYLVRSGEATAGTAKLEAKTKDMLYTTGFMSNAFVKQNGEFKSLGAISGVLKDKFSGMSDSERAAALNTLFGSDARRAATVLTNEGTKGLAKYVKATSDKTAAERMGHAAMKGTAGAMEAMKGSIETTSLAWGMAIKPLTMFAAHVVTDIANRATPIIQDLGVKLKTFLKGVDLSGGIKKAMGSVDIGAIFARIKTSVAGVDWASIGAGLSKLFARIKTAVTGINWAGVGSDIGAIFARIKTAVTGINWASIGAGMSKIFARDWGSIGTDMAKIGASLRGVDWSALPKAFGKSVSDSISVFAVVIGFAARHVGTLARAMPFLIAAFVAYKAAQAASSLVDLAHLPITAAMLVSNVALARSNGRLATQMAITNGVERTTMVTRARSAVATVASAVAQRVAAGASRVWALATRTATAATNTDTLATIRQRIATAASAVAQRVAAGATRLWAIATRSQTAATNTTTAATIRQRVATVASTVATKVAAVATKGMAIAQRVLNLAMRANPIGLVITALLLLGTGLVVAYKKSETFRKIVDGALSAVTNAGEATVGWFTNHLVPFFTTTIPKAFRSTVTWVKGHWPVILAIITGPIGLATLFIAKHMDKITEKFKAVGDWVRGGFNKSWSGLTNILTSPVQTARDVFGSLLGSGGKVRTIFSGAVSAIGGIWSRLQNLMAAPVNWIIKNVINRLVNAVNTVAKSLGVSSPLHTLGMVGGGSKSTGHAASNPGGSSAQRKNAFAAGGVLPGFTPGRDVHHYTSPTGGALSLSGGEAFMVPEWTRAVGGAGAVKTMNAAARYGRKMSFSKGGVMPAYGRTTYGGKTVDWLTKYALMATSRRLGYGPSLTQGSYNPGGVSASGGTHDGGGVVDLSASDGLRKVRALRMTGFAAWRRPTIPGLWSKHIHAVLISNALLSGAARAQVGAYRAHRDGLAGNAYDPTWRPNSIPWFTTRTDATQPGWRHLSGQGLAGIGALIAARLAGGKAPSGGAVPKGFAGASGTGEATASGGGSRFNPLSATRNLLDRIGGTLGRVPGGAVGAMLAKGTFKLLSGGATKWAGGQAVNAAAGIATHGMPGLLQVAKLFHSLSGSSPQQTVRSMMGAYGWGANQWPSLNALVQGESGWNPSARNPYSSAAGLFQKMTSLHGALEKTVAGQAGWGLGYIKSSYGSPANAYAKWSSRNPHWYDDGGEARGIGFMPKNIINPERVLSPRQTDLHDRQTVALERLAARGGSGNGGTAVFNLYDADGALIGRMRGVARDEVAADRDFAGTRGRAR
ncbi:MAG: phage tail tape measure protein [Mycobacteriales bacterium]